MLSALRPKRRGAETLVAPASEAPGPGAGLGPFDVLGGAGGVGGHDTTSWATGMFAGEDRSSAVSHIPNSAGTNTGRDHAAAEPHDRTRVLLLEQPVRAGAVHRIPRRVRHERHTHAEQQRGELRDEHHQDGRTHAEAPHRAEQRPPERDRCEQERGVLERVHRVVAHRGLVQHGKVPHEHRQRADREPRRPPTPATRSPATLRCRRRHQRCTGIRVPSGSAHRSVGIGAPSTSIGAAIQMSTMCCTMCHGRLRSATESIGGPSTASNTTSAPKNTAARPGPTRRPYPAAAHIARQTDRVGRAGERDHEPHERVHRWCTDRNRT